MGRLSFKFGNYIFTGFNMAGPEKMTSSILLHKLARTSNFKILPLKAGERNIFQTYWKRHSRRFGRYSFE
jgi:hypothetical protein